MRLYVHWNLQKIEKIEKIMRRNSERFLSLKKANTNRLTFLLGARKALQFRP